MAILWVGKAIGWNPPLQRSAKRSTSNGLPHALAATTTMADTTSSLSDIPSSRKVDWIVFVDHSKISLEKGAAATLDAFLGLAPMDSVQVKSAFLPKPAKSGGQPWVRCVSTKEGSAIEVSGVDSVDKVYRVLTKHMKLNVRFLL